MELMKKDFSKIQDKLEQTEADLRRVTREKDQLNSDLSTAAKLKDNDVDKLELEITQFNTERDQLVRQLEKSQDMLLSFQQGESKNIFEPRLFKDRLFYKMFKNSLFAQNFVKTWHDIMQIL